MKRILFYSENFCGDKSKGGLEVATYRIAKALKDTGKYEVYDAFCKNWDGKDKSVYKDIVKLTHSGNLFEKSLSDFIKRNEIDVVVNMSRFFRQKNIVNAVKSSSRPVKIIFMQHFAPGSEMKKPTFKSGFHLLRLNPFNPLYWLRSTIYPLIKLPRSLSWKKVYRETYETGNKVILLSKGYIKDYQKISGIYDDKKFDYVPNIFEPPKSSLHPTEIHPKQKRVLILSRMDEIQKRISLALSVWSNIEKDPDLHEWQLDIVGSGHNKDIVKRLIQKLKLERVTYHGWQNREPFLNRSSILMSTSEYEGLPLSILEAQAYGVVPIAFDSYASLKDVVIPFENGVVVDKFGDIEDYTKKLTELMYDSAYREELSKNAINSAERFSSEKIVSKWNELLESL